MVRSQKRRQALKASAVFDDAGKKGEANEAVIAELKNANALIARARLKHTYPHSGAPKRLSFSATRRNGLSRWIKS